MHSNQTLTYYDQNAVDFCENTFHADMSETRGKFLTLVKPAGSILDFGCGSGRDSLYFKEAGYQVDAIDGSIELCRLARQLTGIPVRQMLFEDFAENDRYDGIWACASLLHLSEEVLGEVAAQLLKALHPGGILYASFKYGSGERDRKGRHFLDMDEKLAEEVFVRGNGFYPVDCWITRDVRPGRGEEKWLNLLMKKQYP